MTQRDEPLNKFDSNEQNPYKPHDILFKRIYTQTIAAKTLINQYVPLRITSKLNLNTIKIESESYIEEDGKQKFSDIVYSVKTKANKAAFVYILCEHQSTNDYWIALRLLKYMMLLWERHKHKKKKLPVVIPLVVYNGKAKYIAPTNLFALFDDPKLAKEILTSDYNLLDLQSKEDNDIKKIKHLGMVMFIMKHIHERNVLNNVKRLLDEFSSHVKVDQKHDHVYLWHLMCYIYGKLEATDRSKLKEIIIDHLNEDKGEKLMTSLAQSYINEGIEKEKIANAKRMLEAGTDLKFIQEITRLPVSEIQKLKKSLKK